MMIDGTRAAGGEDTLAMLGETLRAAGKGGEVAGVLRETRTLLAWLGDATPSPDDWSAYITTLREERGEAGAFRAVERLLPSAGTLWGPETATDLAIALRVARCTAPVNQRTPWDRATVAIRRLPADWQGVLFEVLERSRATETAGRRPRGSVLSAASLRGVAYTLAAWRDWCAEAGQGPTPSATGLEAWARSQTDEKLAPLTVAGRLRSLLMGWRLVHPEHDLGAAKWVSADWSERAWQSPPPTKTAAGIVPATEIFALGLRLIKEVEASDLRRPMAACAYRDGADAYGGCSAAAARDSTRRA